MKHLLLVTIALLIEATGNLEQYHGLSMIKGFPNQQRVMIFWDSHAFPRGSIAEHWHVGLPMRHYYPLMQFQSSTLLNFNDFALL